MLKALQNNPLRTSSLIILLYALWFLIPMLVKGVDPDAMGIVGIDGALEMGMMELIVATVLAVFISLLGWWKKIGFTHINKGGLKFLAPIALIILMILAISFNSEKSDTWFLGFTSPLQLVTLLGVMLLLGFVEEGIFRGVLYFGLSQKFATRSSLLISAFIFGLFHFVNIFTGASIIATLYQAIHAFAMGFLYGTLRIRISAIWPLMILHGLWDFSLFVLESTAKLGEATPEDISIANGLGIAAPALIYGLFVYWRLSKTKMLKITF